jgi:hypothetical protein
LPLEQAASSPANASAKKAARIARCFMESLPFACSVTAL